MIKTNLLHKVRTETFDCYSFLVDYEQMALPWPDGYKEPANRIAGQAPIGVNDNYLFYGCDGQVVRLTFGECSVGRVPIPQSVIFNKCLEEVAIENEKLERKYESIAMLIKLLENLTRMKHGKFPFRINNTQYEENETAMFAMGLFEKLFERLAANGHKYTIEPIGREENAGFHFPIKVCMKKDGVPLCLEALLDDLV